MKKYIKQFMSKGYITNYSNITHKNNIIINNTGNIGITM